MTGDRDGVPRPSPRTPGLYSTVVRDRFWVVAARRATAAAYRASPHWLSVRHQAGLLADATGPLPQPRLHEQLAVTLADRLPGGLVALFGVRGLRAAAWLAALPLRLFGRLAGLHPGREERSP